MPGANCSIFGCGTNRRHTGVGIFRIPAGKDELSKETRQAWINVVTKDRVVDNILKQRIEDGNLYICEKHFKEEEVELASINLNKGVSSRKRLVRGAVPTLNLPVKSVLPTPVVPRRELVREEIGMPIVYKNLKHFRAKILNLKMAGWSKTEEEESVVFEFSHPTYTLPKLSLSVGSGLNFTAAAYNWLLPDDHFIYNDTKRSLQFTSISTIMSTLEEADICEGLVKNDLTNSICEDPTFSQSSSNIMRHCPYQAKTL